MEEIQLVGSKANDFNINEVMLDFLNGHIKKIKKTLKKEIEKKELNTEQCFEIKITESLLFPPCLKPQISFLRKAFNTLSEDFRPEDYRYKNLMNDVMFISLQNSCYMEFYFFVIEFYRQLSEKIEEELKNIFQEKIHKELSSLGFSVFTDPFLLTQGKKEECLYFIEEDLEQILASFMNNFLIYLKEIQKGEKPICFYSYNMDNKKLGKIMFFCVELFVTEFHSFLLKEHLELNDILTNKERLKTHSLEYGFSSFEEKKRELLTSDSYDNPKNIIYMNYSLHSSILSLINNIFTYSGRILFFNNSENPIIKSEFNDENTIFKDFGAFSKEDIKNLMIAYSSLPNYRRKEEVLAIFE